MARRRRSSVVGGSQWRSLVLLASVALVSSSCSLFKDDIEWKPPKAGETEGAIFVDTPEVYGRERLIQDRQAQREWLEDQLKIADTAFDTFEALSQRRLAAGQSFDLAVDATAASRDAVGQLSEAASARERTRELDALRDEIERARLEQQLAAVLSGEDTAPPTTTSSTSSTGTTGGAASSGGSSGSGAGDGSDAGGGGGDDPPPSSSGSLPTLALATSQASDAPITRFRRKLAYREIVRQELLENDLDDAHDLDGNTLYRLTFDTTIFPEHDTSKWAVVTVSIDPTSFTCPDREELLDGALKRQLTAFVDEWLRSLKAFVLEEVRTVARELTNPAPPPDVLEILALSQEREEFIRQQRVLSAEPSSEEQSELDRAVLLEASKVVKAFYQSVLDEQAVPLTIDISHRQRDDSTAEVLVEAQLAGAGPEDKLRAFCTLLESLSPRVEPYAVTPKEAIQRIAESSAGMSSRELALGLGVTLGTVGVEEAFEVSRLTEVQQQSVRRQPLVVGFSRPAATGQMDETVGWVIGPRFAPRTDGFDFRHTLVQEPLSALVSMPGWWPYAKVTVMTCWIPERKGGGPWITRNTICPTDSVGLDYNVRLPGEPEVLTAGLLPRGRKPQPFFYGAQKLQIDRKETLVIHGSNLWRSPAVFLGNQKADSVQVLSDMEAIAATFDKVLRPAGWSPTASMQPVKVWTSEGIGFAGDVELVEPPTRDKAPGAKPLFTVESTASQITAAAGKGAISLAVKIEGKEVDEIFVEVGEADLDAAITASTPGSCLDKTSLQRWKITADCDVTLGLKNLPVGREVTVKTYRMEGQNKIAHRDLVFPVRGN